MSEKRYGVHEYGDFYDNKSVTDDGHKMDEQECADLLNEQAETIEVLREWITAYHDESNLAAEERGIVFQKKNYHQKRVDLAKRRIAALEGK